jgi:hypothetical protein
MRGAIAAVQSLQTRDATAQVHSLTGGTHIESSGY